MAVDELHIDFASQYPHTRIIGRRDLLSRELEGNWATVFKGRGLEFTGYRAYNFSDDASMIDWRASLRSKEILVREYEEFKNFNVVFVLDVSNSMLFTSGKKFKAEYAAELVYAISQAASGAGEAIGLVMYSDGVVKSLRPSFGKGMRIRFEMFLTDKMNYGGTRNFKRSMMQLNSIVSSKSIMIFVSDFLNMSPDWEKYLGMVAERHEVYGVMIKDKRDRELPKAGQYVLKDPNSEETLYVDTNKYSKWYANLAKEHEDYVDSVFKKLRGKTVLLMNEGDFGKAIEKFFNIRGDV